VQSSFIFLLNAFWFRVHEALHGIFTGRTTFSILVLATGKASHARPPPRTAARAFVVSCESITASKAATTFGADMGSLPGMQFCVAFQIMQTSES
jgi:hypothetical protein